MPVLLRILGGPDKGKEITLSKARYIIGRGDQADFRSQSELVSREHCAILTDGNQVFVEDLNSSNGTFVNGIQLEQRQTITSGDSLRIGQLLLELVINLKAEDSTDSFTAAANELSAKSETSEISRTLDADSILDTFFDRDD